MTKDASAQPGIRKDKHAPAAPAEIDRRGFLLSSGASLGGFLVNPTVGLLAAAFGASLAATGDDGVSRVRRAHPLLRAGEPVNERGQGLGHEISGLVALDSPSARPGTRALLVIGHDSPRTGCDARLADRSTGLTVVELTRTHGGPWRHAVASELNRRWDATETLAIDGARIDASGRLHRVQDLGPGLGRIASLTATPWGTALACERGGWLIEVIPNAGAAIRRLSLGRIGALVGERKPDIKPDIKIETRPGAPCVILVHTGTHLLRFVSHQLFDPRRPETARALLAIGELSALEIDGADASWTPLTSGLGTGDWERFVRNAPTLEHRHAVEATALEHLPSDSVRAAEGRRFTLPAIASGSPAAATTPAMLAGTPVADYENHDDGCRIHVYD